MQMPYAEHAEVDIRKLRDYCLNPQHDDGKHKARLFASILGMNVGDADALRMTLLDAAKSQHAKPGQHDEFGQRYTIDFTLVWRGKRATLRSGWIVEHGQTAPRLTTCFHYEQERRSMNDHFKLLDVVALKADLPQHSLWQGQVGTHFHVGRIPHDLKSSSGTVFPATRAE